LKLQAPTSSIQSISIKQPSNGRKLRSGKRSRSFEDALLVQEMPEANGANRHPFDLEERTGRFGEAIIRFAKKIPRNVVNNRLIDQLVGSGTSVGANYCEANEGISKKDFRFVIGRCVKEAKETKFFLRMTAAAEADLAKEARELYCEARELHLIFASIFRNTK
jgi:four helix bundle protein